MPLFKSQIICLLILCVFTIVTNSLLLLPTPWQKVSDIERYYQAQYTATTDDELQEMKITRAELKRSVDFSIERSSREIWLRWIASALLTIAHLVASWLFFRGKYDAARVGLLVTSSIYLIGWAGAICVLEPSAAMTVIAAFVERILNEWMMAPLPWFIRFSMLYGAAPLAYIVIIWLLIFARRCERITAKRVSFD